MSNETGTPAQVAINVLERLNGGRDRREAIAAVETLARLLDERTRERDEARRESDLQMQSKLDAQTTLMAITESICLPLAELGNGWLEAAPKILARIEEIVDEADRGFRERDVAKERGRKLEAALFACVSRLALARLVMEVYLKSGDNDELEAWLLAERENGWIDEASSPLRKSPTSASTSTAGTFEATKEEQ